MVMMQANMAMLNKDRKNHVMTQRLLSAARTDGLQHYCPIIIPSAEVTKHANKCL